MAKKKQHATKGANSLEKSLTLSNEELTSKWSKLASVIRQVEDIKWEEARAKAIDLMKDQSKAIDYIESVRSGNVSKSKRKESIKESRIELDDADLERAASKLGKSTSRRDKFSLNYNRIIKIAPDIEERLWNDEEVFGISKKSAYMDFNLKFVHRKKNEVILKISHYFESKRQLIADPEMEILMDLDQRTVQALSIINVIGRRKITVFQDPLKRNLVDLTQKQDQNHFLTMWLRNVINQGHIIKDWRHDDEDFKENDYPSVAGYQRHPLESDEELTIFQPDISYLASEITEKISKKYKAEKIDNIEDEYVKHLQGESKLSPLNQYFAAYSILTRSKLRNPRVSFPSEQQLKADHERLETIAREEKYPDGISQESNKNGDDEIAKTVKHWTKLAAIIKEVEGNITHEKAKQKALKMKREGTAEEYVIKALKRNKKGKTTNLFKANYQTLLRLFPDLNERLESDLVNGRMVKDTEPKFGYKIEPAAQIDKTTNQFAFHDENGNGTLMIAVMKVRKLAWVTVNTNNILSFPDYAHDLDIVDQDTTYKVNVKLGQWLENAFKEATSIFWFDSHPLTPKAKQAIEKEAERKETKLSETREKHRIVIEWAEAEGDFPKGYDTLDELSQALLKNGYTNRPTETYVKNKVWFKNYKEPIRIDVSKSKGDYDPQKDKDAVHLLLWLQAYDSNYNWKYFASENTLSALTAHYRADYPIVLEYQEGRLGEINKGFQNLEKLQEFLASHEVPEKKRGYNKTYIWFRGISERGLRVDVSESDGDYNPHKEKLESYLNSILPDVDWSKFSQAASKMKKEPKSNRDKLDNTESSVIDEFASSKESKSKSKKKKTKFDLLFTNSGGVTVVSDKSREEHGDYKKIAYLSTPIQFFEEDLPKEVVDEIVKAYRSEKKLSLDSPLGFDLEKALMKPKEKRQNLEKLKASEIKVEDYLFNPRHPLMVIDRQAPQWMSTFQEFVDEVEKYGTERKGHWKYEPESDEFDEFGFEFDLEKAKKDAESIPIFKAGEVKLTEQHKRAGITQKDINWINKHKQGIVITPRRNPLNNTKSLEKDLDRDAKRPGKRLSRTGRIYYEGRSNRSDLTDAGL